MANLNGKNVDMTLGRAIEHYVEKVGPNRLKPSTLKTHYSNLKQWRRALGANTALSTIGTADVLDVRDTYAEPATANRMTSVLSALLDVCVERQWVLENVTKRIKPLRVHNQDVGKLISPTDEAHMKTEAARHDMPLYVLLCIAFESGARLGEIEALTEDAVDLDGQIMTFRATKNGTDRQVPLSAELADIIRANGLPGKMRRAAWDRVLKTFSTGYRFHDVRHTMITRNLDRGVPIAVLGKMVGHKTLAMTVRYQRPDVEGLRFIVE